MRYPRQERSQEFRITRATPGTIRALDIIVLLLVGFTPLVVWAWWSATDSPVDWWVLLATTGIVAATGAVFVREAYVARSRTITVTARHLRVRRLFRDFTVPLEHLRLGAAEIVSISDDSPLHPAFRSWGIYIADYWAGWFGLQNGDKAYLVLSSRSPVVHIPTRDGYRLLLSVENPEALLYALHKQRRQNETV
ncbi:MAG: hypothetical protein GVY12_14110 [Bacteroidetes bacterium]|jgi:hypothetical protein|nr:hypothetical protein [Bacteroidota bacterium]